MTMEQEVVNSVSATTKLLEYGGLGILCIFLMGAVFYMFKSHRAERRELHKCHAQERKDWKETTERQFKESKEMAEKVANAYSELKGSISTWRSRL